MYSIRVSIANALKFGIEAYVSSRVEVWPKGLLAYLMG